ncbi:MAG: hypothetical protein KJ002_03685 [Candidatus Dadabacteria bacterium]|nr:hypothetical protein [Candidatus Dadabacteria bacterium]
MRRGNNSVRITILSLFLLALLIPGCTSIKTTSYFTPTTTKLQQYQAVEFETFETEIVNFPEEALAKVPEQAAALLESKNKFKEVKFGRIDNVPATDTVVVLGEVSEYRPSSDVSFEGGSLKFGEVAITIKLAIVNKATGDEISSGEINGFSSLGFMAKDIYESLAEEIVKYILETYQ